MLGRNNGGAEIVVGKFEDSLAGVNEEIGDALGYNLTIISGSIASMPIPWMMLEVEVRGTLAALNHFPRSLSRSNFLSWIR